MNYTVKAAGIALAHSEAGTYDDLESAMGLKQAKRVIKSLSRKEKAEAQDFMDNLDTYVNLEDCTILNEENPHHEEVYADYEKYAKSQGKDISLYAKWRSNAVHGHRFHYLHEFFFGTTRYTKDVDI